MLFHNNTKGYLIGDIMIIIKGNLTEDDLKEQKETLAKRGKVLRDNIPESSKRFDLCFDLWAKHVFRGVKASSRITIYDMDIPKNTESFNDISRYREWRKIYKEVETQNVIIELM